MKQLASAALTLSAQIAIVSGKSGLDREMFGQEPAPEVSTKFASKSNWGFTWNPKSCVEVDESGCWPLAQKGSVFRFSVKEVVCFRFFCFLFWSY
jgi:hypothetical protein